MKRLTLLFSILASLTFTTVTSAQQASFDRATTMLEEQQYSEAIDAYKAIYRDGHVSGALWLNLGVAYARVDSLGKAKFYLMRASEYSETEQIARESLERIESQFSRRSAVLPMLPWDRFFNMLDELFGAAGLMVVGLIILNLTAALLLASWFRPNLKSLFRKLSYVSAALAVLFIGSSVYLNLQEEWYDVGVTVVDQVSVYDRPTASSPVVSTAYEGYAMRVHTHEELPPSASSDAEGDAWSYVRLENGLYGWIESDAILTY